MTATWQRAVAILLVVGAAGCSSLPSTGPNGRAISTGATAHLSPPGVASYFVVDLSEAVVGLFDGTGIPSLKSGFGSESLRGRPQLSIGRGDVVEVTIYESTPGGLFIPSDGGARAGNFVTLPRQTVGASGQISVPYAGSIEVLNRQPSVVESDIEEKLATRAIEPEVIVAIVGRESSEATVLGEVKAPGRFAIGEGGERILDVVSRAGGASGPATETLVTLQRKGRVATVLFRTLLEDPSENVFVFPDDTIFVSRHRRSFIAFGATGVNGQFGFEEGSVSLAEGVARAGGLLDNRADPGQVFLYRYVPGKILERLGLVDDVSEAMYPVIFRINLRAPQSYFLAQEFKLQDKDILYVDNASSVALQKFVTLVNGTAGAARSSLGVAIDARTLAKGP